MVKKYGLALEGGGSRGAYEAGALKFLTERGYKFSIACGTSIGSINAAMVAQGGADKLYELWEKMSYSQVFNVDEKKILDLSDKKINRDLAKYLSSFASNTVKEKGVDTSKIRELLSGILSEKKIRKNKCDFGLVTICLTDKKGKELYKEDIKEGLLLDYILASSRFPGFKQELLEDKYYTDGGMYNNCPINMVARKGVKDIVVIRVGSLLSGRDDKKLLKRKDLNILLIEPNYELPNVMNFDNRVITKLLKLGYYDAMKKVDGLIGMKYYVKPFEEEYSFKFFTNISYDRINEIYSILKIKNSNNSKKKFLEDIMPLVIKKIGRDNLITYTQVLLAISEYIAEKLDIDEFEVMSIEDLISRIITKIEIIDQDSKKYNNIDRVIFKMFLGIKE